MSYPNGLASIIGDEPLFVSLVQFEDRKGYFCLTKNSVVVVTLNLSPIVINVLKTYSYLH